MIYNQVMDKRKTFLDRTFKDKNNKLVLWQKFNIPLAVGLSCTLLTYVIKDGKSHALLELLAYGALFTWGFLEVYSGVNYFRRLLGLAVLAIIVANHLK